jgi:hypothetical protein
MSDPKRWLEEPGGGLSFEQRLVLAGKELTPPAQIEEQVWAGLLPMVGSGSTGESGPSGSATSGGNVDPAAGGGAGARWRGVPPTRPSVKATAGTASTTLLTVKFFVVGAALGIGSVTTAHGLRVAAFSEAARPMVVTSSTHREQTRWAEPARADDGSRSLRALPPVPSRALGPEHEVARTRALGSRMGSDLPLAVEVANAASTTVRAAPTGIAALPQLSDAPIAPASPVAPADDRDHQLQQEAAELARAKNLLGAGQAPAALTLLDQSSQRFPAGVLAHEREALTIEALVDSGERELGRRRARRFLARYPGSPLADRLRKLAGLE